MPRVERSTNILTGMIIAALYVILLVGFARESYMYRDAARHEDDAGVWPAAMRGVSNRACRIELTLCKPTESMFSSSLPAKWRAKRDDP